MCKKELSKSFSAFVRIKNSLFYPQPSSEGRLIFLFSPPVAASTNIGGKIILGAIELVHAYQTMRSTHLKLYVKEG